MTVIRVRGQNIAAMFDLQLPLTVKPHTTFRTLAIKWEVNILLKKSSCVFLRASFFVHLYHCVLIIVSLWCCRWVYNMVIVCRQSLWASLGWDTFRSARHLAKQSSLVVSWFRWESVEAVRRGIQEAGFHVTRAKPGSLWPLGGRPPKLYPFSEGLGLSSGNWGTPF